MLHLLLLFVSQQGGVSVFTLQDALALAVVSTPLAQLPQHSSCLTEQPEEAD
jgi:hypothetical protein